jgi:hypothetical protein
LMQRRWQQQCRHLCVFFFLSLIFFCPSSLVLLMLLSKGKQLATKLLILWKR